MNAKIFDVFGIGNPIIDFLVRVNEEEFRQCNLKKGMCHIMEENEIEPLFESIKGRDIVKRPGDATANTLNTIAQLGGNVVYTGKIGNDEYGTYYEKEIVRAGIKSNIKKGDKRTGRVIVFVTPDAERTFAVNLGAAYFLEKEDLSGEEIKKSKILYITAYQLESEKIKEACMYAIEIAKENDVKIAIDLADIKIIEKIKDDLKKILQKADIIFANEKEAQALTGLEETEALIDEVSKSAELICIKMGERGSLIKDNKGIQMIKPFKAKAIDTTGAGDNYASGILYGLTHSMEIGDAARLASYLGAKVVGRIGARLSKEDLKDALFI